jgi:hypothetical protein
MRRGLRHWHAAICAAALAAGGPAFAADLALKRVVLSTGGVGYFEFAAQITGDAALSLDVPLDEVDDILKSIVVYDPHGTAGEVTLPGRQPLEQSLADLPFPRSAFDSSASLLTALQGAEVRIAGGKPMAGRLISVVAETARGTDGLAITLHRVTLATETGLRQFVLEDADSISFADPRLQREVGDALARIAAYRATARRRLSITIHGSGARGVRVGYVVAAPLWKATYRAVLPPEPEAAAARLQGWAVLENFSGEDWQGVELTLLSGNPVTFRQSLYQSYYVTRPTVPVEVTGRVLPPPDTGAIAAGLQTRAKALAPMGRAMGAAPAPAAAAPPPPAQIESAQASEGATETSFTLPYPVDVAAGQSLLVPIIDRDLPAHSVDVYRASLDARHPLAALELKNDGKTALPPGVMTLYETAAKGAGAGYLGDTRLAAFPSGEQRLLSYAVDGKVTVDRTAVGQQPIVKAAIANGILRLTRQLRQETTYRIAAPAGSERHLVIEQPRLPGWTLTAPESSKVLLTADSYRIPATLKPGGVTAVSVTMQRPLDETVRLFDIDDNRLAVFVQSSELAPQVRQALGDLAARRQAVAARKEELDRLGVQRRQLADDEKRLRANLAAVGHDSALYKRTLDKLGDSENAIEGISDKIAKENEALAAANRDLQAFVAGLKL